MAEVRKEETFESYVAGIEKRLREVEALAARQPSQTVAVELANQFTVVTAGTFTPTAHSNLPAVYFPVLNVWQVVTTPVGTTAEVRVQEFFTGLATDPVAVPSGANGFCMFTWLHGIPLVDPANIEFQVQARRTGGAGNVNVYGPRRFAFEPVFRFPTADADGNPVFV